MRHERLDAMIKGWFVGGFSPTVINTEVVEVGVKEYAAGDKDVKHYHKIASEVTVVLRGDVKMNGHIFSTGDIIVLDPGEWGDFAALTDATTVVVKLPGAPDDKYVK